MGDPISVGLAGVSMGSQLLGGMSSLAASGTAQQAARIKQQGAEIQAEGARFSAKAEANAWTYKAAVADMNKRKADEDAQYATQVAEATAQKRGIQGRQQIGEIRARQGASGLSVAGGTAQKVVESEAEVVSYEEAAIRSDGARQAYNMTIKGLNYQAESDMDRTAAENAIKEGEFKVAAYETQKAGYKVEEEAAGLQGFSSLIGSTGSLAKSAFDFYNKGVFG